jgi:hypothetical protein
LRVIGWGIFVCRFLDDNFPYFCADLRERRRISMDTLDLDRGDFENAGSTKKRSGGSR